MVVLLNYGGALITVSMYSTLSNLKLVRVYEISELVRGITVSRKEVALF